MRPYDGDMLKQIDEATQNKRNFLIIPEKNTL
jgi:hypothetical protein